MMKMKEIQVSASKVGELPHLLLLGKVMFLLHLPQAEDEKDHYM